MGYDGYWSGQNIDQWISLLNEYKTDPTQYPLGWTEVNGTKYFLKETDVVDDMFRLILMASNNSRYLHCWRFREK